mmetsp:Transcript_21634/g.50554  ORF Transcript_21634/g.50554 Transcript_21634/m.50554 type:complete len:240 (+) Transcript_21634:436-1155(+)
MALRAGESALCGKPAPFPNGDETATVTGGETDLPVCILVHGTSLGGIRRGLECLLGEDSTAGTCSTDLAVSCAFAKARISLLRIARSFFLSARKELIFVPMAMLASDSSPMVSDTVFCTRDVMTSSCFTPTLKETSGCWSQSSLGGVVSTKDVRMPLFSSNDSKLCLTCFSMNDSWPTANFSSISSNPSWRLDRLLSGGPAACAAGGSDSNPESLSSEVSATSFVLIFLINASMSPMTL